MLEQDSDLAHEPAARAGGTAARADAQLRNLIVAGSRTRERETGRMNEAQIVEALAGLAPLR